MSRSKSFLLISFLVAVWGISWPIYKVALPFTPPLLFAGMRTFLGGLLIAGLLFSKRKSVRWKDNWKIYVTSSIFNVVLFYGLQTVGLSFLPSGLFSVLVYLQPVLVGLLAWAWLGESMTPIKMTGLFIGFIGVAVVSSGSFSGHISAEGVILALLTGISWAFGTTYVKKVSLKVDSMWLVAFQFIIGGAFLTIVGSGTEKLSAIVWNTPFLIGLVFGIILGISASWMVYFTLVNQGDASRVASYTFLVPLISVFSGTLFLHEPFTVNLLLGLVLIAVSIYFVNKKPKSAMPEREEAALR